MAALTGGNANADQAKMNQIAFEISLNKDYPGVSSLFIKQGLIQLTWEMVDNILKNNSERLFKQCIRYQVKFDFASSKVNNMRFAGATT
jgi:hypothetical protein